MIKTNPVQSENYYCDHFASSTFPVNNQEPFVSSPPPSLLRIYDVRKENSKEWAILDSGASSHFLVVDATATKVTPAKNPATVTTPDGSTLKSTHVRELDLPQLPMAARIGHVIPGLASRSLISVVQLTDHGCGVYFLKHCVTVTYRGRVVLEGARDINTKLWMVRLTKETPSAEPAAQAGTSFENANHVTTDQWQNMRENRSNFGQSGQFLGNITHTPNEHVIANITRTSTKPEVATYHHQSLGSPQCHQY